MNNVALIGNLGRPVELRELGGGKVVGKTILAVTRMRKGQRAGTDWIPIVLWDNQATNAARYLRKGSRVGVDGRLHGDFVPRKPAEGGEAKSSRLVVEVIVDRITYLSPARAAGEQPAEAEAEGEGGPKAKEGRR
jgi:single-strand DNA-binding protein